MTMQTDLYDAILQDAMPLRPEALGGLTPTSTRRPSLYSACHRRVDPTVSYLALVFSVSVTFGYISFRTTCSLPNVPTRLPLAGTSRENTLQTHIISAVLSFRHNYAYAVFAPSRTSNAGGNVAIF
jgi:hypothetical protein